MKGLLMTNSHHSINTPVGWRVLRTAQVQSIFRSLLGGTIDAFQDFTWLLVSSFNLSQHISQCDHHPDPIFGMQKKTQKLRPVTFLLPIQRW
jgi:hypothetical protein